MYTFEKEVELEDITSHDFKGRIPFEDQTIRITYEVDIEIRSWGIKDVYVSVPDQTVEIELENGDYHELKITDCQNETKPVDIDSLYPKDIQWDQESGAFTAVY